MADSPSTQKKKQKVTKTNKDKDTKTDTKRSWQDGAQARTNAVKAMMKRKEIVDTETHVGFGSDTSDPSVYKKSDLAELANCKVKDRCWLVGVATGSFVERAKFCTDKKCDNLHSQRHKFNHDFYVGLKKANE